MRAISFRRRVEPLSDFVQTTVLRHFGGTPADQETREFVPSRMTSNNPWTLEFIPKGFQFQSCHGRPEEPVGLFGMAELYFSTR